MAKMSRIWSIFTAVFLLAVQLCTACSIWSSAGPVVQRGSSFMVYCTFECKSLGKISSHHPPTPQTHEKLNSTTIFHNVVNITRTRTFSCLSSCDKEPCGMDIQSGYFPEKPKNISCTYDVRNDESGVVFCEWKTGRDTHLSNELVLWVKTVTESNHTAGPKPYGVSSKRTDTPSTSFTASSSDWMISVWVKVKNQLGCATSATVNYLLRDIGNTAAPHQLDHKNRLFVKSSVAFKKTEEELVS